MNDKECDIMIAERMKLLKQGLKLYGESPSILVARPMHELMESSLKIAFIVGQSNGLKNAVDKLVVNSVQFNGKAN